MTSATTRTMTNDEGDPVDELVWRVIDFRSDLHTIGIE